MSYLLLSHTQKKKGEKREGLVTVKGAIWLLSPEGGERDNRHRRASGGRGAGYFANGTDFERQTPSTFPRLFLRRPKPFIFSLCPPPPPPPPPARHGACCFFVIFSHRTKSLIFFSIPLRAPALLSLPPGFPTSLPNRYSSFASFPRHDRKVTGRHGDVSSLSLSHSFIFFSRLFVPSQAASELFLSPPKARLS